MAPWALQETVGFYSGSFSGLVLICSGTFKFEHLIFLCISRYDYDLECDPLMITSMLILLALIHCSFQYIRDQLI